MNRVVAILATLTFGAAVARAQPVPDVPIPPDIPATDPPPTANPPPPTPVRHDPPIGPTDPYPPPPPPKKVVPKPPLSTWCPWRGRGTECLPEVLTIPTGWLLPGAMLYSKTSVDTGGGFSSDHRIGLGDVAEFGIASTDAVREKYADDDVRVTRIQPYVTASFRIGVPESRIFSAQPGLTLGFRKSFERHHSGFKTKIAELTLVASKHLHERASIHLGGAFWDASLNGKFREDPVDSDRREVTLHGFDDAVDRQLRVFGGIAVRPLDNSEILVDLGWVPEFCYHCTSPGPNPDTNKITLKPVLSWGVRTMLATWVRFEAGVRLPDIGEANLLDAQIFGQLTLTSGAFRSAISSLQ